MNEKYESPYCHIYNRGSDKREIFMDERDYERFLECLREFNTEEAVCLRDLKEKEERRSNLRDSRRLDLRSHCLVEIFCYCLMPNHFHLILKELVEGGVARFMHKVGIGYTMYFNKKHSRSGHLFQGKYKHKEIDADFYLTYLTGYIHLNPVMAGLVSLPEEYRHSSYLEYIGKRKSDFLDFRPEELEVKAQDYAQFVLDLKMDKESLEKVSDISLEE